MGEDTSTCRRWGKYPYLEGGSTCAGKEEEVPGKEVTCTCGGKEESPEPGRRRKYPEKWRNLYRKRRLPVPAEEGGSTGTWEGDDLYLPEEDGSTHIRKRREVPRQSRRKEQERA